jgi:AraC-like DNA-binding protein
MQSHFSIQLISALTKILTPDQLAHFTTIPLNWVLAKLYTLREGHMLTQTLSNYLVHIELFEFNIAKDITFNTLVHKSSFFMFVMFQGKSVLSDHLDYPISETMGNSCVLSHLKAGHYNWHFLAGQHKMLCLTFRNDYFIRKGESMPQFKPLIDASLSANVPYLVLPHCASAKHILKLTKKMLVKNSRRQKSDAAINIFIDEVLNHYQESLIAKQYDTHTIHKLKVAEITSYIHQHYHRKDTSQINLLASRFNVSERSLKRMVSSVLQMSLHDYIIKLRMNKALTELSTSNKTVKEIAAEVGYSDPLYFSRVFKNYYKVPPSEVDSLSM